MKKKAKAKKKQKKKINLYLSINLTKYMQDQNLENYKMLME
jgi:hypothetical protein